MWNKLKSDDNITNSEIGPEGIRMKNFEEYILFVIWAKLNGQEIGWLNHLSMSDVASGKKPMSYAYNKCTVFHWDWRLFVYVIKLPKGYEYIIENGEIALRMPKFEETYFTKNGFVRIKRNHSSCPTKHLIIKRVEQEIK